ncbi:hypothetical protein BKA83DRAFT_4260632 [Pisolithus microcarpus]|nr:hypothetical protein BKA83DRAFT_4260632 [Pisolithus microcarpus]
MRKKKGDEEVLVPLEEYETPEELAERERLKAERLERMREDPYYIIDDQTSKPPVDDVDSIPIAQLDELPPPTPKVEPRLFTLKSSLVRSSSPRFVMPEGAMPAAPQSHSAPITRQQTPSLFERISALPPILPSFQQYDVPESDVRASTPEPIKVTKAKRKGTGTGKKKRTTEAG